MRIAVIGATGRTGGHVVEQGLMRGHHMIAIARRREAISLRHPELQTAAADVLDHDSLLQPLTGADAIVSTLGIGTSRERTTVYSQGIRNVLSVMAARSIRRLSVISAAPVGPRAEQPLLERHIIMPILDRVFGGTYEDMRLMEALLRASDVDWVSLRPPRLIDKGASGRYRVQVNGSLPRARSLIYADLATALLDSLGRDDLRRRAAFVAN